MKENKIELRNIRSLSGLNFYIPDYQRGYRWTKTQAIKMMNDFEEFIEKKDKDELAKGEFYCLQPIVVKPKIWNKEIKGENIQINGYEVIDGQQRLTSLYILFKTILQDVIKSVNKDFNLFNITYETRQIFGSDDYLKNINTNKDDTETDFIDFFYMKLVYKAIREWIENKNSYDIVQILLQERIEQNAAKRVEDLAHNVRVIWYEIGEDEKESSVEIFTRLNIGKIPLTNAELIKALLLRKSNFGVATTLEPEDKKRIEKEIELKQLHISEEWNVIEQKLQNDAFWYFIYNTSNPVKYETRIEYIFDLMKDKYEKCDEDKGSYFTFEEFNKEFENNQRTDVAERIWQEIKEYFRMIEYWYDDHTLFHLVGFLIEYKSKISELIKISKEKNKIDFLAEIKTKVKTEIQNVNLDTLTYGKDDIKKILLLFNVLTILESDRSDLKFPFDKYKKESWDQEHISAKTDKEEFTDDAKKRQSWLDDMLFYFGGVFAPEGLEDEERGDLIMKKSKEELEHLQTQNDHSPESEKTIEILSDLISTKVQSLLNLKGDDKKAYNSKFNEIYSLIRNYFNDDHIPEENKDSISNIALLNASINRSYGNAFFPIKRNFIKQNDSMGVFVPIATKNVFMKYYSKKIDNMMYWTEDDADAYLQAIKDKLFNYLTIR